MAEVKTVAIIGGGIAGLAAAYYLQGQKTADGKYIACAVIEKSGHLGGNGYTAYFDRPFHPPFADLGVNDFNLAMYTRMAAMLKTLHDMGYGVGAGKLNNSECFFTSRQESGDNPVVYTDDDLRAGGPWPAGVIFRDLERFEELAEDVLKKPQYAAMTVDDFIAAERFTPEFRNYFLLPRINAMYFMGETVPQDMPIRGVMSYYAFQEGLGSGKKADRRFFERGCTVWFIQLWKARRFRGVQFLTSTNATVTRPGARPRVSVPGKKDFEVDHVVLAIPADEVANVVQSGLPQEMPALLAKFRYINSIAIAHTWPGVMPAKREQWRTYNIRIQPQDAQMLRPYNISYVESMHQGGQTPTDDFVTEDPHVPIPDEHIRRMCPPSVDLEDPVGEKIPAVTYFRHNTITLDSIQAQARISSYMQGHNNFWYTGGWTHGAGLHEEIMVVAEDVASRILGRHTGPLHTYSAEDPEYVPLYIRQAFGDEPLTASPTMTPDLSTTVKFEL